MTEIEKYLKYKIKYENLKYDINFQSIDSILDNLGYYYNIIKKQYEIHSGGGNDLKNNKLNDKKYYKKYKNLIKSSAKSINYYKNMIQLQISNQTKLNNYYSNLVRVLRSQRNSLATGLHVLGNDFKNEKDKINMLETMINGLEKYIQSSKTIEVDLKKIKLSGGAFLSADEFETKILEDMSQLSQHIETIDKDKIFLESKIKNLHDRMKNIVVTNDVLFKIKAEIEWLVNQLENAGEGEKIAPKDFEGTYLKIQELISRAKEQGKITEQMSEYIHKLEEYAAYLLNFIKSNEKTIGSIDLSKIPIKDSSRIDRQKEEDVLKTKLLGGSNFKKLLRGGTFEEEYFKRSNNMIEKLNNIIGKSLDNINLESSKITESLQDDTKRKDKNFPIYFGKISTLFGLIQKLDYILNNIKTAYTYLQNNFDILKHDDTTNDLIAKWKDIFSAKKTNFYTRLLEDTIYSNTGLVKFEDFIKQKLNNFITIKIDIDTTFSIDNELNNTTTTTIIDNLLKNIDNTVIAMDHIYFIVLNLCVVFLKSQISSGVTGLENTLDSIEKTILEKKDNLLKSSLLNSSTVYSILYGNDQTAGAGEISFPTEPMQALSLDQIQMYLDLFTALTKNTLSNTDQTVDPIKLTSNSQIDKTIELSKTMNMLYDKLNERLGSKDLLTAQKEDLRTIG